MFCVGADVNISDVPLCAGEQIHITENSVQSEKILILKIRADAPLEYPCSDGVCALVHKFRYVELRLKMRSHGIADIFSIYIEIQARADALEHYVSFSVRPVCANGEFSLIHAARVVVRHIRRIHRMRIVRIGVAGFFPTLHLPARRHGGFVPGVDFLGHIYVASKKLKFPCTVEEAVICRFVSVSAQCLVKAVIRDVVCSLRFAVIRELI